VGLERTGAARTPAHGRARTGRQRLSHRNGLDAGRLQLDRPLASDHPAGVDERALGLGTLSLGHLLLELVQHTGERRTEASVCHKPQLEGDTSPGGVLALGQCPGWAD
jgi:hypothetical protein